MCEEYCSQWGMNEKWLKQGIESWCVFQRKRIHPCSHNKFCPKRDGGDISTSYQNNHDCTCKMARIAWPIRRSFPKLFGIWMGTVPSPNECTIQMFNKFQCERTFIADNRANKVRLRQAEAIRLHWGSLWGFFLRMAWRPPLLLPIPLLYREAHQLPNWLTAPLLGWTC